MSELATRRRIVPANEAGCEVIWDEIHVGTRRVFEPAGFAEVSHPTKRRVVMRIDF